jgi:hypothetical protein
MRSGIFDGGYRNRGFEEAIYAELPFYISASFSDRFPVEWPPQFEGSGT